MSTHAVVGVKTATGFRGRYVHLDGYPSAMIPALTGIVARDGVERALRVITQEHTEWSTLSGADAGFVRSSETFVPGYGRSDDQMDTWYTEVSRGPAHWAYALSDTGIEVWQCVDGASDPWTRRPSHDVTFPSV